MSNPAPNVWLPYYIATGLIWGCSFVFIKMGLDILPPVGVAFWRNALGAIALWGMVALRGLTVPRTGAMWRHVLVLSVLLNSLPGTLFAWAETSVTSVFAGILNGCTPIMTLIVILLAYREEKPRRHQVVGLMLGLVGVLLVVGAWRGLGDNEPWAVLALVVAVTGYGIAFPYIRRHIAPSGYPMESLAAMQVGLGALTLLPFYGQTALLTAPLTIPPVLAMLALGMVGTGFAYAWNFHVIAVAGSSTASTVTYISPVVATLVGVLFLGEPLSWNEPVGGMVVLLGAAIGQGRLRVLR